MTSSDARGSSPFLISPRSRFDPASLAPYAKDTYDPEAYEEMRAFRSPFITTHYYAFYVLAAMIVVHIAAVVITEAREGGTLISAMFTGRKIVAGVPLDLEDQRAAKSVQDRPQPTGD